MRCRICGNKTKLFETVDSFCFDTMLVNQTNVNDMKLYRCPVCTHIQTEYVLDDDFYNTYDEQRGASQYLGSLDQTEQKLKKLRSYANSNFELIDIGCGHGKALRCAETGIFENCLGVEPAYNTYCIAKKSGLNVINAYFSKELNLEKTFSAFVSFQVFEHLDDLYAVLDYAYDVLEAGGVGLINVPNGAEIIGRSLYHQLTFEHINYFTANSIATMVHRAGFEIIQIENIPETIELDVYVRKPNKRINFQQNWEEHKEKLNYLIAPYKTITVWGAGAKSEKYARLLDKTVIVEHIVDFSDSKLGTRIAGIEAVVEKPTEEIIRNSPVIVIFASAYNAEIIEQLRTDFLYEGEIIYFDEDNDVKSNSKK